MNGVMKTKSVVEGGILAAITILFGLMGVYMPVLGTFVSLLWPIPLILLIVRQGSKLGLMALAVSAVLMLLLANPLQALSLLMGLGLVGIVLGHSLRHGDTPVKTLVLGSLASAVSKVALLALTFSMMGINPIDDQARVFQTSLQAVNDLYRSMGINEQQLALANDMMNQMAQVMTILFPGIVLLASVADTLINYTVAKKLLHRLGTPVQEFAPFASWRMPRLFLGVFLVGLIAHVSGKYLDQALYQTVGLNVMLVAGAGLLIQGLSVMGFYMNKYKLSKTVRVLLYALVFIHGFFLQVAVWLGLFDMVFDYRKIRRPEGK